MRMFNAACLSDLRIQPSPAIQAGQPHKVAFLDRDGVINVAPAAGSYVLNWRQFRFADGTLDMLKALVRKDYRLVVVTNQQGVGKGLMDLEALAAIHRNLSFASASRGAPIDGLFSCPHLAEWNCACRKPKPGLIHEALRRLPYAVDLARSWMIGDSERDIQAAAAAGLRSLLIGSAAELAIAPDAVAANVREAAQWL